MENKNIPSASEKTAIVTGASRGIGEAAALRLAADGMFVVINYNGSEEKACMVRDKITEAGGRCELYRCDVSDYEACQNFVQDVISRHKRVDVLVNNAGITRDDLLARMKEDAFDSVIRVNLKGTFNTMKAVARQMMKQRYGRIINMSSVSGIAGNAGQTNYAASKAGVIGMTKSAAKELASRGVTVNAVAPGFINTDMTAALPQEVKDRTAQAIPAGVFGEPAQVAAAVSFLASEDAGYITGQVLQVDGGLCM